MPFTNQLRTIMLGALGLPNAVEELEAHIDAGDNVSIEGSILLSTSEAASLVLTSDGSGGVSWETVGGGSEVDPLSIHLNGDNSPSANIPMGGFKITNLGTPTLVGDATTKAYVDAAVGGGSDPLAIHRNNGQPPLADISWGGFRLTNLGAPTAPSDAATRGYVNTGFAPVAEPLSLHIDGSNSPAANINFGGFKITNVGTPTLVGDAASKAYVDSADATKAPISEPLSLHVNGDNSPTANIGWGGFKITSLGTPTLASDAATKAYADTVAAAAQAASAPVSEPLSLHINGDNSPTANVNWGGFKITNLGTPTLAGDATTKAYVDGVAGGGGVTTMTAVGATPNANAATISGPNLTLQPASALFPGAVTTGVQSFAGEKTFTGDVKLSTAGANLFVGTTAFSGVGTGPITALKDANQAALISMWNPNVSGLASSGIAMVQDAATFKSASIFYGNTNYVGGGGYPNALNLFARSGATGGISLQVEGASAPIRMQANAEIQLTATKVISNPPLFIGTSTPFGYGINEIFTARRDGVFSTVGSISNATNGGNTAFIVGQDGPSYRLGYLGYNNDGYAVQGALKPTQVVVLANVGVTNGVLIDAYGAAPVAFATNNIERMSVNASGLITLGSTGGTQTHALNTSLATNAGDTLILTNAPTGKAGNPAGYINITINGVARVIPFW